MHLYETTTFTGEYISDHYERSCVCPNGCDHCIPRGPVSQEVREILYSAETLPPGDIWDERTLKRRVTATFTGNVVQEGPDDYALYISKITDLKITDPGSH
jgi:hypothetical protein